MDSASIRVARSRSRRRFSRSISTVGSAGAGDMSMDADAQHTVGVSAVHAARMLHGHLLSVMIAGAFDEAMRQSTKLARRIVAHQQCAIGCFLEAEMRTT